ncbi:MAG TPA: SLBB domain-containing protein [Chthonomonadaceae bacterium]|nr:SLBB domain-containing protein [Chthonomonadaceae bacterium]
MKNPSLPALRFAVSALAALAVSAPTFWMAAGSAAQNAPAQTPGQAPPAAPQSPPPAAPSNPPADTPPQGKPDQKSDGQKPEEKPLPANPLIIVNPQDGSGNADAKNKTKHPSAPFGDYAHPSEPDADQDQTLPLYGYDFFQSARDLINARRAYMIRKYRAGQNPFPERTTPRTNDQRTGSRNTNRGDNPDQGVLQNGSGAAPLRRRSPSTAGGNLADESGTSSGTARSRSQNGDSQDQTDNGGTAQDTVPNTGAPPFQDRADTPEDDTSQMGPEPASAYDMVVDPVTLSVRNINAVAPSNYQLGSGDSLTIRYWSPTMPATTITREVMADGTITLHATGPIVVRGLTLANAEKELAYRLGRYYRDAQVSLTLGKLRTMPVTISGNAFLPGNYMVPATMTAYNMLYAAGGPTDDGTLRSIQILRNGKHVGHLDMYKFLIDGVSTGDVQLQPGDTLYVPPRLSRITVTGEVRKPAIYELLPSESMQDALRYAGGVKASGVAQRIQVDTVEPGVRRIEKDVDAKNIAAAGKVQLYDGDKIDVFSVRSQVANQVTIEGAVDQPSDYELMPDMRVADLVARARGPIQEAYLQRADLLRWNQDNTTTLVPINLEKALAGDPASNIALKPWDRLKVYTRKEVAWTGERHVTVEGAVQRPGVYLRSNDMRVSDLLLMAGGPTPDATLDHPAILLHKHPDGTYSYDKVRLPDLAHGDDAQNPLLQDNDVLALYRVDQAQFEPDHVVTISGEVVGPGVYPRGDGMHLKDLLEIAGGFKPDAGSMVTVTHAGKITDGAKGTLTALHVEFDSHGRCAPQDDVVLEDGDVVTVQGTGGFEDHVPVIQVSGAVNHPGPIPLTSKSMRLSDAIKAAGGLRPEAFPQGAEFNRDPKEMTTNEQRNLTAVISQMNDIFNMSDHAVKKQQATLDMLKAANGVATDSSPLGIGASAQAAQSPAVDVAATQLANPNTKLVPDPRKLTPDQLVPNGYVAVNLQAALRHPGGPDDIVLMGGDAITIPEAPTTIQVVGAVYNPRGVLYRPGVRLEEYVAQAGGFTPDSARDRIEVIHMGGGLIPASKVHDLQPGDIIVVPTKVMAAKISSNRSGLDSFFRSILNTALIVRIFGL